MVTVLEPLPVNLPFILVVLWVIARTAFLAGPTIVPQVVLMFSVRVVVRLALLVLLPFPRFPEKLWNSRDRTMLEPLWVFCSSVEVVMLVVLAVAGLRRWSSLWVVPLTATDTPALALLLGMGNMPRVLILRPIPDRVPVVETTVLCNTSFRTDNTSIFPLTGSLRVICAIDLDGLARTPTWALLC